MIMMQLPEMKLLKTTMKRKPTNLRRPSRKIQSWKMSRPEPCCKLQGPICFRPLSR